MKTRIIASILVVAVLVFGAIFLFATDKSSSQVFNEGTTVGGVDIGGLSRTQAYNKLDEYAKELAGEATLDIIYKDKVWQFNGANFSTKHNAKQLIDDVYSREFDDSFFRRLQAIRQLRGLGAEDKFVLNYIFDNIEEKMEAILSEIEQEEVESTITFDPKLKEPFKITKSQPAIKVDKAQLIDDIITGLQLSPHVVVYVVATEIQPEHNEEYFENATRKISSFTTDYRSSITERKNNIKLASSALSGLMLEPDKTYSFNQIVGVRTGEAGYAEANIITGGKFEKGVGGGVCQVSTTLYNALVLAGIDIVEVHKHSLPISYAPLALDAMVSYSTADLKFKNISKYPAFIKAENVDNKLTFTIFGNTLEEGQTIKTSSKVIKEIPHNGDSVVLDLEGKYADRIMFKGEYIRESYPKVGYEVQSYIAYYEEGKLIKEIPLRRESYMPQYGIVYEGADELPQGMTLPKSEVSIIGPKKS
ncbi:MAG: VanW family protein [Christensenellaceae bacterium]|jgi:vancomycin resistance protein YoaR|nr:VanW family protein [Christensenellaceae bacterium]